MWSRNRSLAARTLGGVIGHRPYFAGSPNSFAFADSPRRFHDLTVSTYQKRLRRVIAVPKTVLTQSPLLLFPLIGVETTFNWLYSLPDVGIALLLGMVGACLLAGVPFLREKLLRIQVPADHSEAANNALGVVIGFTGGGSSVFTRSSAWQSPHPRSAGRHGSPQPRSVRSFARPVWRP
jgi:hypothetical protein